MSEDPQGSFGRSALLDRMHETAPAELVAQEVGRLLSVLGENDPSLLSTLITASVNRATLAEMTLWNQRVAPNPQQDRLGRAASLFWAAQTLVTTVMRSAVLDLTAEYPPQIDQALSRGADGLFDVGQAQFEALARLADNIIEWLTGRNAKMIAFVELPLGNTVPVQLLKRLADQAGLKSKVITWNAPRNDKPSLGYTVEVAADLCANAAEDCDYVVFLDEALSGSRFIKLFEALLKRLGRDKFLPIAILFDDTFRPDLKTNSSRERLIKRLKEQGRRIGFSSPVNEFPLQRLFRVDGGNHVRWQSPVIWGIPTWLPVSEKSV